MVKVISATIFFFLSLVCFCQEKTITSDQLDFNVYFSKDTTCFNDTVEISLFYKNKTEKDDVKILFPTYSRIFSTAIGHVFSGYFIFEDTASRILYNLKNTSENDTIVVLRPNEIFIKTYKVIIKPDFFYKGKNNLYVFHRVWNYPMISDSVTKKQQNPYLSLTSSDVCLYVETCIQH